MWDKVMKLEWKKLHHYRMTKSPCILDIPEMNFLSISGKGNPNSSDFQARIKCLYGLAYPIKIRHKKQNPDDDFTIFPLEGVWDLDPEGRLLQSLDKNHLVYEIMIAQPECIRKDFFEKIQQEIIDQKHDASYGWVEWKTHREGLCCQMLHVGPYDTEKETFDIMEHYVETQGYVRTSKIHREIYVSDARKTEQSALKTILRFNIQKKE
jgi:hypothetical protein